MSVRFGASALGLQHPGEQEVAPEVRRVEGEHPAQVMLRLGTILPEAQAGEVEVQIGGLVVDGRRAFEIGVGLFETLLAQHDVGEVHPGRLAQDFAGDESEVRDARPDAQRRGRGGEPPPIPPGAA